MKPGDVQDDVLWKWVGTCAQRFLRPQIELIQPKLIACLGKWAYKAVLAGYGLNDSSSHKNNVERKVPVVLPGDIMVIAVFHPGPNERRNRPSAWQHDWARVGALVQTLRNKAGNP